MIASQHRGFFALVFATLFFGSYGILYRFIGTDFGIFFQGWVRAIVILFFLSLYIFYSKHWRSIEKIDYKWFVLMAVPGVLSFLATFVAFNNLVIGTALFIFYACSTIGGYLLGFFIFREKITQIKIISLIICLVGLLIISSFSIEKNDLFYLFLTAFAGFSSASWNIFSKKISSKYPFAEILFVNFIISFAVNLLLSLYFKDAISLPVFSISWISVFLLAIVTLCAASLTIYGFKHMQAQVGSLVMLLEIVFGTFFAWLFFKETLTPLSVVGGAFIIFGVALPNLRRSISPLEKIRH
jgi:drug/metabolite transporter (DMT)-like permease